MNLDRVDLLRFAETEVRNGRVEGYEAPTGLEFPHLLPGLILLTVGV